MRLNENYTFQEFEKDSSQNRIKFRKTQFYQNLV